MAKSIKFSEIANVVAHSINHSSISAKLLITSQEFQFETIELAIDKGDDWFKSKYYAKAEYCYASGLKLAMEKKDIEQQIKLVQMLGDTYIERKHQEVYTKAAALYNYALNLCQVQVKELEQLESPDPVKVSTLSETQDLLLYKLKATEVDFVRHVTRGSTENIEYSSTHFTALLQSHLDTLASIRINAAKELEKLDDEYNLDKAKIKATENGYNEEYKEQLFRGKAAGIRQLFAKINEGMKGLIATMVYECHQSLGESPCEYAIIGLGSMARGEMTPYSDFEFGILIGKDTPEIKLYFYNFTNLLYLKVINLGETILPSMTISSLYDYRAKGKEEKWFYDDVTPRGFAFDGSMPGACKLPFGEKDEYGNIIYELIHTPKGMSEFQCLTKDKQDKTGHLSSVLCNVTCVTGSKEGIVLVNEYKKEIEKILNSKIEKAIETKQELTIRQECAIRLLQADIAKYDTHIWHPHGDGKLYDVKKEIYRLPNTLVDGLALYLGLESSDGWSRIEEMYEKRIISVEASENLKVILSIAVELRLHTYLSNGKQGETMSATAMMFDKSINEELSAEKLEKIFLLPSQEVLFRFYYTTLPLRERLTEVFKEVNDNVNIGCIFESNDHLLDTTDKNKGLVYNRLLHYSKAKLCFEQWLEKNPQDHSIVFIIGRVCEALGDHKQSIQYNKKALKIVETLMGKKHPEVALIYNNLGNLYVTIGEHNQATQYLHYALEIQELVFGRKHYQVASALGNLGLAYGNLGNYKQAIQYLKEALKIKEKLFGRKHFEVAAALNNLGTIYENLGDYDQAIKYVQTALEIFEKILGRKHPEVAGMLNNLGNIFRIVSNHKLAIKCYQEALETRETVFGRKHYKSADTLNNIGLSYVSLHNHNQAIQYLQEALEVRESVFGRKHHEVAKTLNNLGAVYKSLSDHNKAIKYYQEALEIMEGVFGRKHPDIAAIRSNLAAVFEALGDYKKSIKYYMLALEDQNEVFGRKHHEVVAILNNLGNSYETLGDHKQSVRYYQEILEILELRVGRSHPDVAKTLSNLGISHKGLGNYNQSIQYLQEAYNIFLNLLGPTHLNTKLAQKNLQITLLAFAKQSSHSTLTLEETALFTIYNFGKSQEELIVRLNGKVEERRDDCSTIIRIKSELLKKEQRMELGIDRKLLTLDVEYDIKYKFLQSFGDITLEPTNDPNKILATFPKELLDIVTNVVTNWKVTKEKYKELMADLNKDKIALETVAQHDSKKESWIKYVQTREDHNNLVLP